MARYENILETIGHTPSVRVAKLEPPGRKVYVKVEAFNPMGSVKDRLAVGIIEDAERRGALQPGQTVIEATSGNTGIGLAMVCAQKGYPLVVTMAENFSVERRKMMRFLGARVVLTPAADKGSGMLAKAAELAERHGWFLCRQFENEANADAHSRTTAQEILADFEGERLDYWVTGFGTGGTLKGVARVLAEKRPDTKVVVCEPDNSQTLGSGIGQARSADGSPSGSHPNFRPHLMQGWSPDFIPKLAEDAANHAWFHEIVPVAGSDALRLSKALAQREGIFVGISSGATLAGALKVAEAAPEGTTVLCMLPDTGERYLSTTLFEDVPADMTEEEIGISQSTARFRFDAPAPDTDADESDRKDGQPVPEPIDVSADADEFVGQAIGDAQSPVVMFALEWCEFCWSVRKMLAKYAIPYRSIDLDSVEYQAEDRGGKIRTALNARTTWTTIPQIFIGGEFIGGATDIFDACKSGELRALLEKNDVDYDRDCDIDPYTFLPTWLQTR
jgi:cysteine synthase A